MKNISGIVLLIILAVVLLLVWKKFDSPKNPTDPSKLEKGLHDLAVAGTRGAGGGILDGVGELVLDSIKGIGGMFSDLLGLGANDSASLIGSVPTTAWSGVSQGNPFTAEPAQPLPYGNPPAGTNQPVDSSDFGGDFLPQAWPPQ